MSRVIIDARESGSSTGRYVDKLVEYLPKLPSAREYELSVIVHEPRFDFMTALAPNFTIEVTPYQKFTFGEQLGFARQLRGLRADIVHFGKDHQPVLYRGRTVTTMHDLTTLRFNNPSKNRLAFTFKQLVYKWVVKRVARKSSAIITGSAFVKDDIVKYSGADPEKIHVIPLAADTITDPPTLLPGLAGKQFIMYVGRPMPHKNLWRLIEAFEKLQAQHPDLYLALAGKRDANYERIEAETKKRGVKNLIFTGHVHDAELRWLYENCAAYIFPSLSEGFGLPGLEAMAHGAPVVSSNATCLPEVYGGAAHYFDPLSVVAIADAINEVLTDQGLRSELIKRGHNQIKKYSWRRTAEQTLAVYASLLRV